MIKLSEDPNTRVDVVKKALFEAKFILSYKGKRQISYGGYTFSSWVKSENKPIVRWYCTSHHSRGCKASLKTSENQIIQVCDKHNHLPGHWKYKMLKH
ncbi:unnamed protein product [Euphydryas editha]|uniref:FLYWCH-type domain-containing protein n=1 Tax=Euphydryas editha TaxID=104508 RepID=A0AAU9TDN7_EUPED|nr:unnamed protein product [Euphydryas editha]